MELHQDPDPDALQNHRTLQKKFKGNATMTSRYGTRVQRKLDKSGFKQFLQDSYPGNRRDFSPHDTTIHELIDMLYTFPIEKYQMSGESFSTPQK